MPELHISEQRFDQLRTQVLQAGLESLEPRRAGRRPPRLCPPPRVQALQARVSELEIELRAAQVHEEIALALPAVGVTATEPAKKSPGGARQSPSGAAGRRDPAPPSPNGVEPRARLIASSAAAGAGHLEQLQVLLDSPSGRRHVAAAGQLLATATSLPGRAGPPARGRLPASGSRSKGRARIEKRRLAGHLGTDLARLGATLAGRIRWCPCSGDRCCGSEASGGERCWSYWSASAPGWGWRVLAGQFPEMPRAELADLLRRYRRIWIRRHAQ